ncbi:MAG: aminomethyl-transferring glycine dehydrogenase [Gammaproteobacteria bacterium]|jgi:glycine dehydrogenase|nr:aminomethyl-transferring glycine dehydrogenase [Gammaproteobacteria bacterium]MBT3860868.1 aminomethyl-transferring glycine dehydrogenase [Gammaproteobacteria bacterium]MBT3988391.1 aminomethyl-transferring glycine dehydrogenase [Gammaproteobacteria bacterium]MBT4256036.1 aminomethyl-transferring glycine dehydrogenase [Gammaproteobacteria bacterium]MBT4581450.1 aminomethyl-transferring glycine dehydrogenase [Gammaproteobacteria bacterium]
MRNQASNNNHSQADSTNSTAPSLDSLQNSGEFIARHIGPNETQIQQMLSELKLESLEALVEKTVPESITIAEPMGLAEPMSESAALGKLKNIAAKNKATRSFIGLGYYDTHTPNVILRNVLENPGWYTAYTPYQPEISQGRLECLLNFQQMTLDLTAMDLANASLLDEATAAAEAMALAKRVSKNRKANKFFVDQYCLPQTIDVIKTRAECFGFELIIGDINAIPSEEVFGAIFQYPSAQGQISDLAPIIDELHQHKAIAVVAADLMSLVLLKPPGEMGADVVTGSTQRFGVPMGYGGPHAAYFATKDEYKRAVPGRIIGVSVDKRERQAFRMALQTREQHIRREKANSNICTAQVLLANISALFAMYHGPEGLHRIASRIHRLTTILATGLRQSGMEVLTENYFDTLSIKLSDELADEILTRADSAGVNLRLDRLKTNSEIGLSLDECTTEKEIENLWYILLGSVADKLSIKELDQAITSGKLPAVIPDQLSRSSKFLQHPNFNSYHSETDMLRYLKRLEDKDISLTHAMIPLGSCTMKLNAAAEMMPISWPEFAKPHPFSPLDQMGGYQQMIGELEDMLAAITGFDSVSMQPNSGAQGEYAGLLAIKKYLHSKGETQRDVCLIPTSAHGTNPASAQMISMKVVLVACDDNGNIDVNDLRAKAEAHSDNLAALMITYPSTHGVFEEAVKEVCQIIHDHGGQVYMDGANLNAQVGVSKPAEIGADVSHVNLHKTFCIPHGGGGPGMGPIGVKQHLAEHLANHSLVTLSGPNEGNGAVSAAPWGSSGILPISWMYIAMMGEEGLLRATQVAILNANYIASRLKDHFPVLYTGRSGMVAHECIIDLRPLKQSSNISEEDVAKRLMDFGFHAPTMSFPVAGTLMIEPTESESKPELDRFIDAMIQIRKEIEQVDNGKIDEDNNPLKNSPHTLADMLDESWDRPYSKMDAAYPLSKEAANKYWPSVNRIDNVYGDRNLFCACPAIEDYE